MLRKTRDRDSESFSNWAISISHAYDFTWDMSPSMTFWAISPYPPYLWERFHLVHDEMRMSGYFRWQNVTLRFIIKIPYMSSTVSPEWNNRIHDLLTWYSFRINSQTCLVPINEYFYEYRRDDVRAPTRFFSKSITGTIYKPTILNFKSEQISKTNK